MAYHNFMELKKGYAMKESTILEFKNPSEGISELEKVLKIGAERLLKAAVEEEVASFLSKHKHKVTEEGHAQIVRNGHLPERTIQTGLGDIPIKVPRTRDRGHEGIKFTSQLLPPYLKRTKNIEDLLPWLYLKGLSTGDFPEALSSLLGARAKGLSSSTVCRLKAVWEEDLMSFRDQDLSKKQYAYWWVDGVYFQARMEEKQCMLVILGADETGKKELVALVGGFRESDMSWREVLLDLKTRGLKEPPKLCVGHGPLGFWKALRHVYGGSVQTQRCWFHKMGNVLNSLPRLKKYVSQRRKKNAIGIYVTANYLTDAPKVEV